MTGKRGPDCEALVTLISTEDGGRSTGVSSGYRPQHDIRGTYLTSGRLDFLDIDRLDPGETSRAYITFLTPEEYPDSLWVGRRLALSEGSRIVGYAQVTRVFNSLLDVETPSARPRESSKAAVSDLIPRSPDRCHRCGRELDSGESQSCKACRSPNVRP